MYQRSEGYQPSFGCHQPCPQFDVACLEQARRRNVARTTLAPCRHCRARNGYVIDRRWSRKSNELAEAMVQVPEPEGGSDSRLADRRGFVGPTESAAVLCWQFATAHFAPAPNSPVSSIDNARHRLGRAGTRHGKRRTVGQAGQSGGTGGPPKRNSTDSPVQ